MLYLLVLMAAAVVAVPVATRLGLGNVLGYLIAGAAIGPWGLKLIWNVSDILTFSEFGVVLLLFIIASSCAPAVYGICGGISLASACCRSSFRWPFYSFRC